jgi:threonine dehydratase
MHTQTTITQRLQASPVLDYITPTPTQKMECLSCELSNDIFLKREDHNTVNSFKIRGAFQKITSLSPQVQSLGVVAASAGNHAQGVAKVCSELNIAATIVMPETTPQIKVDGVRKFGANVILHGNTFDESNQYAKHLATTRCIEFIHPFDDMEVILGQGTVGVELVEQVQGLDYVFVQVGGGGLAAGMALAINELSPETKVIAVEPEGAQSLGASLSAGKVVKLDRVCGFSDGVAVQQMGEVTFNICQSLINDYVTVSKDEVCSAIQLVHRDTRAIPEASGAVGLAGAKKYMEQHNLKGKKVGAILSGSNISFEKLEYVAQRCNLGLMTEKLISVELPEKQGELTKLLTLLEDVNISELQYRIDKYSKAHLLISYFSHDIDLNLSKLSQLSKAGYHVSDIAEQSIDKSHYRFMMAMSGKRYPLDQETFYNLKFPEKRGTLLSVLNTLFEGSSITALNYRNDGSSSCSLLLGILGNGQCIDQRALHSLSCHVDEVTTF